MAIEIERRFLVRDPQAAFGSGITHRRQISQGYFGCVDGLRVRVRIVADGSGQRTAVLTLKGRRQGICREEYECPLGLDRAEQALGALPPTRIIRKTRYWLRYRDELVWSIDLFRRTKYRTRHCRGRAHASCAIRRARPMGRRRDHFQPALWQFLVGTISDRNLARRTALPDGREIVCADRLTIEAGPTTLVSGPSGSGKSTLFRAISGIWPYGRGTINRPADATLMLVPQRPYVPSGTLKTAVSRSTLRKGSLTGLSNSKLRCVTLPTAMAR
jgi:CYTH domain-containing protein